MTETISDWTTFNNSCATVNTATVVGLIQTAICSRGVLYAICQLIPSISFRFVECLFFGAIISATDPGKCLFHIIFLVLRQLKPVSSVGHTTEIVNPLKLGVTLCPVSVLMFLSGVNLTLGLAENLV